MRRRLTIIAIGVVIVTAIAGLTIREVLQRRAEDLAVRDYVIVVLPTFERLSQSWDAVVDEETTGLDKVEDAISVAGELSYMLPTVDPPDRAREAHEQLESVIVSLDEYAQAINRWRDAAADAIESVLDGDGDSETDLDNAGDELERYREKATQAITEANNLLHELCEDC